MLRVNQHTKLGVKFDEFYFVEDYTQCKSDADVSTIIFSKNRHPDIPCKVKGNIFVDLRKPSKEIVSSFTSAYRREVKRSMRDDEFVIERKETPNEAEMEEFCTYFNEFSKQKGIYTIGMQNLLPMIKAGAFLLTKATCRKTGEIMCFVTYIWQGKRASAHFGCSHFRLQESSVERQVVGRANKYLHYQNMLYFKEKGCEIYDFGGYHQDEQGLPLTGIDDFKQRMGGEVFQEYAFYYPRSIKGKLALRLRQKNVEEL